MFRRQNDEPIGSIVLREGADTMQHWWQTHGRRSQADRGPHRAIHGGITEGLPLHHRGHTNLQWPRHLQRDGIADLRFYTLWIERRVPETRFQWMRCAFANLQRAVADPKWAMLGVFRCVRPQPYRLRVPAALLPAESAGMCEVNAASNKMVNIRLMRIIDRFSFRSSITASGPMQ